MVTAKYKINGNHIYVYFSSRPDVKTIEMIKLYAEYRKDLKAWRLYNNSDNLLFVESLMKSINPAPAAPPDRLDSLPKKYVGIRDVMIRGDAFQCKNHRVEEFAGVVPVFTRIGTIERYVISLWYCHDCQYYFVFTQTFQDLKAKGVILCKVTDYKTFNEYHPSYNIPRANWREVSPLRMCGYCVNQNENLTDEQRHGILEEIIDRGILTRHEVTGYLNFFIEKIKTSENALEKWRADFDYISNYKLHSRQRLEISGFYKLY